MLAMMSLDTVLIKIEWDGEGNIFINDFVEKYQSGYKATMLQCWPAQLSQHSSCTPLPSIIR